MNSIFSNPKQKQEETLIAPDPKEIYKKNNMKLLAIACGSAAYWIFKFILIYKLYASGDRHVLVTEEMAERRPLIICFISIFLLSTPKHR